MQRRVGGLGAVMFTDIVDSTAIAAEMGNARWSELVARHHRIGLAAFSGDFGGIRRFADRDHSNIVRWSTFEGGGGHHAVHKVPDLLVGDGRSSSGTCADATGDGVIGQV
jgi:class 3 adenylate cyclase